MPKERVSAMGSLEIDLIQDYTPASSSASKNTGTSTPAQAVFNLSNAIVGAGIIGLPYALKQAGLVSGLALMLVVAGLTNYSLRLLLRTAVRHRKPTYEDLVFLSFGTKGIVIIILGDTVSAVLDAAGGTIASEENTRRVAIGTAAVLFLLPLVLLRDITHLSRTSGLSIACVVAIELVVLGQAAASQRSLFARSCAGEDHLCAIHYSPLNPPPPYRISLFDTRIFSSFGIFAFAFTCHDSSFIIYRSMKSQSLPAWRFTTRASVSIAVSLCVLLAVAGYLTFTTKTDADLLNNYPGRDRLIMAIRILYALTMVFTFPMAFNVSRDVLYGVWVRLRRRRLRLARRRQMQLQREEQQREREERQQDGGSSSDSSSSSNRSSSFTTTNRNSTSAASEGEGSDANEESASYPTDAPLHTHLAFTLPLFFVCVGISLVTDDLGVVLELTGGLAATCVGFILPSACALKLDYWDLIDSPGTHWTRSTLRVMRAAPLPSLLLGFGVCAAVVSVSQTLSEIANPQEQ